MEFINRHIEHQLAASVNLFPVTLLTGARQTGKSTLLQHDFLKKGWDYYNLDERKLLKQALEDPDLFIQNLENHTIIDEAHKAPDLFHSVKWHADQKRPHKVILSGSANFLLLKQITESLAGRAGIIELHPLSLSEKLHRSWNILEILLKSATINDVQSSLARVKKNANANYWMEHAFWGGYPKILSLKDANDRLRWFEAYKTSYLERDIRDLAQVGDLLDFQRFYEILAFQIGNLLNLSSIANDIGLSMPTCKKYLQILCASYQFIELKPYFANARKRLVKTPKIYIGDTGMAAYLTHQQSPQHLRLGGQWGNFVENMVISEMIKYNSLNTQKSRFYFWRTSNGAEVDLVIDNATKLLPIEIKTSTMVKSSDIRGLSDFLTLKLPTPVPFGIVFYRGENLLRLEQNILAVPLSYL